jgi:drug/metabolite transporter (DMT)-like permease
MSNFDYEYVWRLVKGIFCVVGAVWVVWRGNAYDMPMDYSMMPAVMCAISGMVLVFLGLSVVFKSREVGEE